MMRQREGCLPLCASLKDRYGDHGLISVVVAWSESDTLRISDWIMSCRVLARGVEQYLMNRLFSIAAERGHTRVTGEFLPTAKNALVTDFWRQFGFESSDGRYWSLATSDYVPQPAWILENAP